MTAPDAAVPSEYYDALVGLAQFSGASSAFWPALCRAIQKHTHARSVCLVWRAAGDVAGPWKVISQTEPSTLPNVDEMLSQRVVEAVAREGLSLTEHQLPKQNVAIANLHTGDPRQQIVVICDVTGSPSLQASMQRLSGFIGVAGNFDALRQAKTGARDATRLAQAIETLGRVLDSESFDQATLTFVNDLSELFACETVSLSWVAFEGLRLRATSHSEKVQRRSEATALLEEAGQEAMVQGREVMFPGRDTNQVDYAHRAYDQMAKPGHMLTLPLMYSTPAGDEAPVGAVTLERQRMAFSSAEQWALRLYCEIAVSPLRTQIQNTRWLPVRVGREILRSLPRAAKPRTNAGKIFLGVGAVAMMAALFVPLPFRLSATAVLKTDATAYVSPAYDGFIESSTVILGSKVEKGDPIFTLNTAELTLEHNAQLAELAQSNREVEIRRSMGQLAEMQLATSKSEELRAKLVQLDYKLASATAVAPISGIVVEGEPAKKLGEPVRRGESQTTISAVSSLYVQAAVSERDLSFIEAGQHVELTLLARPKDSFAMQVAKTIPAAQVQDADNVFPVLMNAPNQTADWWLPGMTGVVKISAGTRPLWWLASRKLVDYLRLLLWL